MLSIKVTVNTTVLAVQGCWCEWWRQVEVRPQVRKNKLEQLAQPSVNIRKRRPSLRETG